MKETTEESHLNDLKYVDVHHFGHKFQAYMTKHGKTVLFSFSKKKLNQSYIGLIFKYFLRMIKTVFLNLIRVCHKIIIFPCMTRINFDNLWSI